MNSLLLKKTTCTHLKKTLFTALALFLANLALAQTGSVKGTVNTSDGQPAEFVNVALQGSSQGTTVNKNGQYVINHITPGSYLLVASFTGLVTQTRQINVAANGTVTENFTLSENNQPLQDVVISSGKVNKFTKKSSNDVAKMPLTNLENPQAYSTVTKELMEDQAVFTVEDALKNVPGITKLWDATGRAGSGGAYYTMRGFATSAKLRNGVTGTVNSTIDAANLESIEVIKGPSATLFGSSLTSYGGLINRITKMPFDTVGGSVSYAGGSYGLNRVAIDYNAPLDKDKQVLFRLNSAYSTQNSFRDNGFSKGFSFAPSIEYKASDQLTFNFDAEIFQGKANNFQSVYFYPTLTVAQLGANRTDQLHINYYSSYIDNSLYSTSSNINLFGQMKWQINSRWKLQTNISTTHSESEGPQSYFYLLPNSLVTGNSAAKDADYLARLAWTPTGGDQSIEIQPNLTGDFKIGKLRDRLTVGLDYYGYRSNQVYNSYINTFGGTSQSDFFDVVSLTGANANYYNFNASAVATLYGTKPLQQYSAQSYTNTYSAYAVDILNLTNNLMAMASLRVDRFNNQPLYSPTSNTTSAGYNQTALSPKFGLVYQVVPKQVSLFGNYQNGFTNQTGTDYAGKAFKPEQANQLEGGVKFDLFEGKLSSTISYYDIKVNDIVRTYAPNPNFSIQNGTQLSKGVEAEVIANPLTGFNIIAGYAYNDSKYENIDADGTHYLNGYRPTTAGPANHANLWLSYRISQGDMTGLGFGFGGNYASRNYEINNASQGQFYNPAYTVLNAGVSYDKRKFRLGFNLNNLTNKEYWVGYGTINSQITRNYVMSAAFKF